MRVLLVGAGGVGAAFARIGARRPFAGLVIADYDLGRAQRAAAARDGYEAVQLWTPATNKPPPACSRGTVAMC
jgi:saccharopine dehydrogenase (NAD+, L-lysine forming)